MEETNRFSHWYRLNFERLPHVYERAISNISGELQPYSTQACYSGVGGTKIKGVYFLDIVSWSL